MEKTRSGALLASVFYFSLCATFLFPLCFSALSVPLW